MTVQLGTVLARVDDIPDHRRPRVSRVGWSPLRLLSSLLSSLLSLPGIAAAVEVSLLVAKAVDLLNVVEDAGLIVGLVLSLVISL